MKKFDYNLSEDLLNVNNVNLEFNGNLILRDININIKNITRSEKITGQVIGFLGPSGIGKSQLSKIIAGLQKPTSGEVLITDKRIPIQNGLVGYVAQNYLLFEHRTIFSNLMVACSKNNNTKNESKEKIDYYLDKFGLYDKKNSYPSQLSGGQKQRVAIAQQMLCSGHFLIMDEPFSGLDIINIEKVSNIISSLADEDELNTIIIVTHDVTSATLISDTLWLMGRDKDIEGNFIKGATIKYNINLIDMGLAWQKDIQNTKLFTDFIIDLKHTFRGI